MASSSYVAPKGTEVSSNVAGEVVRVSFKDGTLSTADEGVIAILDSLAEAEGNPIGFAPKET